MPRDPRPSNVVDLVARRGTKVVTIIDRKAAVAVARDEAKRLGKPIALIASAGGRGYDLFPVDAVVVPQTRTVAGEDAEDLRRTLRESLELVGDDCGPEVMRAFYRALRAGHAPEEAARLARSEHGIEP